MAEVLDHRGNPQSEGAPNTDPPEIAGKDSDNFFTEWQLEPAAEEPVSD